MSALEILENRIVSGYLRGLREPAMIGVLRVDNAWLSRLPLQSFAAALAAQIPALPARPALSPNANGLGHLLVDVIAALLQNTGAPQLEPCKLHCTDEGPNSRVQLIVPIPGSQLSATCRTLHWLAGFLERGTPAIGPADLRALQRLTRSFRMQAPQGGPLCRMLESAYAREIPWLHMAENVYQFGWGAKSRLLDGTFTDRTPAIATRLARLKSSTVQVLRQAGLPVPLHHPAANADEAVKHAKSLGWPVVVKPADLDGGRGVQAGLATEAAVRKAYAQARALSSRILVEKHVAGRDYRVVVMHGTVAGVWERIPASVTGDGKRDVRALLAEVNADPRRQPGAQSRKQIVLDSEALELLAEQGLGPDAIPASGRFVRLRRTANIASGGSSEKIAPEAVHPDNILLCERAARLLRLDLAGVDLLMPDIGRSWLEGGAAICEVNAQPQLPYEFPAIVLQALIADDGRIPVAVVMDDEDTAAWLDTALAALHKAGVHSGCVLGAELRSGDSTVSRNALSAAHGAQVLLRDPQLEVLLVRLRDPAELKHGFPVDRCDVLVLAGGKGFNGEHAALARILEEGSAHIVVNAGSGLWKQWKADGKDTERVSAARLGARIARLLLDGRKRA